MRATLHAGCTRLADDDVLTSDEYIMSLDDVQSEHCSPHWTPRCVLTRLGVACPREDKCMMTALTQGTV